MWTLFFGIFKRLCLFAWLDHPFMFRTFNIGYDSRTSILVDRPSRNYVVVCLSHSNEEFYCRSTSITFVDSS